jgi:hypothetical protein
MGWPGLSEQSLYCLRERVPRKLIGRHRLDERMAVQSAVYIEQPARWVMAWKALCTLTVMTIGNGGLLFLDGTSAACLSSARLSIVPFPTGRSVPLERNNVRRSKPPIAAIPGDTRVQRTTILLTSRQATHEGVIVIVIHWRVVAHRLLSARAPRGLLRDNRDFGGRRGLRPFFFGLMEGGPDSGLGGSDPGGGSAGGLDPGFWPLYAFASPESTFPTATPPQSPSLLGFSHFPTATSGVSVAVGKVQEVPVSSGFVSLLRFETPSLGTR